MAQFTIYKSSDSSAPLLYGCSGSLVTVFDACLVNGYGSKPGAGWTKPFANTGSVSTALNVYGCYKQPTGSAMTLFINDNTPSVANEAWATGWENLTGMSSSVTTTVGSGSGQFPLPAQSLTNGRVVIRKSVTADSSSVRSWVMAADSSSFYFFAATGDTAGMYFGFGFGDIYSFKSSSADTYKCIIMGRSVDNSAAVGNEGFEILQPLTTVVTGNYIVRTYTNTGTSVQTGKHGDSVKGSSNYFYGGINYPNPTDSALYLSPIWVVEPSVPLIRGQLRGLYQPLHPIASFMDGQTFSGSLDYAGKSFMAIKESANLGFYVIETSNTLLTN